MPVLQEFVAAEKARLEKMLCELKHNYEALCNGPEFENLSLTESSDPYGDCQILTSMIPSALRPFYAHDLLQGSPEKKRVAQDRITSSIQSYSELMEEAMLDAENQIGFFRLTMNQGPAA